MAGKAIQILIIPFIVIHLLTLYGCYMHTKHEIEAHITIDIRQIKEAAVDIEDMVSGQNKAKDIKLNKNFSFPISQAYAEETKVNYITLEIKTAIENRKLRYSEIEALKYEGAIGENNKGLLEIRGESSLKSAKEVEKIVQDENQDREIIYMSIVKQNNYPDKAIDRVKEVFALTHFERAKEGEWVQTSEGKWIRK